LWKAEDLEILHVVLSPRYLEEPRVLRSLGDARVHTTPSQRAGRHGTAMTNNAPTRAKGFPSDLPTSCPSCGQPLQQGILFRHSVGPGRAARWLARLAVLLGFGAFFYTVFRDGRAYGGYGHTVAALAGLLVWSVCNQIATRFPRSRLLRCLVCRWQKEFPAG
jgi:hypothetical protein